MFSVIFLTAILLNTFITLTDAVDNNENDINSSCSQTECLRCDLGSSKCVKCLHVMMVGTRTCQHKCPQAFDPIWAEEPNVFGRICQERSVLAMVSHREVGIIAGASVLGAICVGIFLGVLLLRKNGVKVPPDSPPKGLPRSLQDKRPKTAEVAVKGKERAEFLSRLRLLRSDAPYIFRMMVATRNRFRSGAASGHDTPSDAKTKACKAVVRDLSRVLCLISLKEEHLQTAPKDWRCLLSWTERLLVRYKRQEELKVLGESGLYDSVKSPQGISGGSRTLFVTRQQQLKAEQERRRLGARSPLLERDNEEGLGPLSREFEEVPLQSPSSPIHLDYKDMFDPKELILKTPSERSHDHSQRNFLTQRDSEHGKPSSGKSNRKKIRDILNLNKSLWLRLTSPKGKSEEDLEKGCKDVVQSPNSPDIEGFDDFALDTDDIPSQIFFDHIEAFAFDLQDDLQISKQKKPDNVIQPLTSNCDDENKRNSKFSNSLMSTNNNYKNNLNLYRNYKNSRLFLDVRSNFYPSEDYDKIHQNKNQRQHSIGKEKRPSKLRRLSSSILMKDKKHLSLVMKEENSKPKKRRPLKRQKQVEKDKHLKILEKYQKCTIRDDTSSKDSQSTEGMVNASVDQNIEGGDVYFSVVETPVSVQSSNEVTTSTLSAHDNDAEVNEPSSSLSTSRNISSEESRSIAVEETGHIRQSDNSRIKITVSSLNLKNKRKPQISSNQNLICDRRYPENPYSKCEILTNV